MKVFPWYVTARCHDCGDVHKIGPYATEKEANQVYELIKNGETKALDAESATVTVRAEPLSDDELLSTIRCHTEACIEAAKSRMLIAAIAGKSKESVEAATAEVLQQTALEVAFSFRPEITAKALHDLLSRPTLGEVAGHA